MICDLEYQSLTSFLELRHRLPVPETNHLHLGDFVSRRLEERACTLVEYLDGLPTDLKETNLAIDAATIGETYFFRDESHFSLLLREFLPFFSQLGRVPLAWSAAASTGEEALSIAALYAQFYGAAGPLQGRIWASDINALSVEHLRRGSYRASSLRDDGRRFHAALEPWLSRGESCLEVDPRLRAMVEGLKVNLMCDSFDAIPGKVDILFLRNMMIYFPHESRKALYGRVGEKLSPEGILVLGKSEVPFFESPHTRMIERGGVFFFVHRDSPFADFARRLP